MNNLTIKYNRKDFFSNRIYTEDTKTYFTKNDLVKAFSFISKDHDAAIQIDSMCIYWDCISDFEKKTVTVRIYDGRNYTRQFKSKN